MADPTNFLLSQSAIQERQRREEEHRSYMERCKAQAIIDSQRTEKSKTLREDVAKELGIEFKELKVQSHLLTNIPKIKKLISEDLIPGDGEIRRRTYKHNGEVVLVQICDNDNNLIVNL